jgi:hypothetical protein
MRNNSNITRNRSRIFRGAAALMAIGFWTAAYAGNADVVGVETNQKAPEVFDFRITIHSNDIDQHHYADRLEAIGQDGTVYGTTVFEQPHTAAQPFTTDMSNVWVPGVVNSITFRVHFTSTGYDGMSMDVKLGVR